MADYFVDHGAYATAIGATPTWGVPQEGDGSSKDAATASSIASIAFGSVPTTGTFSCCGVSISTTGVIGAASADAAANTLASNINAVTTAVGSGVAVGVPQLRNLVYARGPSGGAPAGTCQIMMRIGSTKLNYATNSNAAIASSFDGTPTVVQFAGGSGGCWGYLLNAAAMGVSNSIAALAYGVMFFQPYVWTATPTVDDVIWARTGTGRTITYSTASTFSIQRAQTWPMRLVFDTNTKWTGDSGTGQVLIDLTTTNWNGANYVYLSTVANVDTTFAALAPGGLKFRLFVNTSQGSIAFGYGSNAYQQLTLINVDIDDPASVGVSGMQFSSGNYGVFTLRGCRYTRTAAQATLRGLFAWGTYACTYFRAEGCSFQWNINGVSDPGSPVSTGAGNTSYTIIFDGCDFSGWASGNDKFTLFQTISATSGYNIQAINCTGLKLTSTYSGLIATTNNSHTDPAGQGFLLASGDSAQYRYEQKNGLIEWDAAASPAYPTLSSVQLDGSTPWSLKAVWMNNGEVTNSNDLKLVAPSLVYRGSAATKTITLEMFCRSAMVAAIDAAHMCLMVTYVKNSTGKMATELVLAVPSSSSASWTGAGSWSGYAAYKLALTTANAIKPNTEIKVQLRLHGKPGVGQNENIFIDPEFGIA